MTSSNAKTMDMVITEGSHRVAPLYAQRFVNEEQGRIARKIEKKERKIVKLRNKFKKIELLPLERNEVLIQVPTLQQKDA